jgi:hypothetical protein
LPHVESEWLCEVVRDEQPEIRDVGHIELAVLGLRESPAYIVERETERLEPRGHFARAVISVVVLVVVRIVMNSQHERLDVVRRRKDVDL